MQKCCQSEDWREALLMGVGDIKGQPIYQMDVEWENLLELPEQETTREQCLKLAVVRSSETTKK